MCDLEPGHQGPNGTCMYVCPAGNSDPLEDCKLRVGGRMDLDLWM